MPRAHGGLGNDVLIMPGTSLLGPSLLALLTLAASADATDGGPALARFDNSKLYGGSSVLQSRYDFVTR